MDFEEFKELHAFLLQTQSSFHGLARAQGAHYQYLPRASVSQALQTAGAQGLYCMLHCSTLRT